MSHFLEATHELNNLELILLLAITAFIPFKVGLDLGAHEQRKQFNELVDRHEPKRD